MIYLYICLQTKMVYLIFTLLFNLFFSSCCKLLLEHIRRILDSICSMTVYPGMIHPSYPGRMEVGIAPAVPSHLRSLRSPRSLRGCMVEPLFFASSFGFTKLENPCFMYLGRL